MADSLAQGTTAADAGSHRGNLWSRYLFSTDHKIIALQYMFTGMFMGLVGGLMAYVFRMQLAFPGQAVPGYGVVTPYDYNSLVTNHGTIMIFWVAMPILIAGLGNFLIPLMIGCDDMVFPRLNRLSYQIFFLSTVVILVSLVVPGGGFGGAWTAYPPLSASAEYNHTPYGAPLWLVAVALEFVAFLLGGINFLTTVMNARAPGMKAFNLPVIIWMIVVANILFMASVGPLIAGAVMLLFDQTIGTQFYNPQAGGDPLLWQHLFWFFGHPEVYVVLLPAMGVVAEVITVFARKKLFAYRTILYTAFGTAVLSFIVWAHHQFVAGIDPRMAHLFTITTLLISIPIAEMVFSFIATLYGGSIELKTPMLWALAFIAEFLIGGVTGIFLGSSGTDIYLHDSSFVVAHFHYTFFPIAIIAGLRRNLLLVPEDVRPHDERDPWEDSLLGDRSPVQFRLHPVVHPGCGWAAPAHLQLRALSPARDSGPAGAQGRRDDSGGDHAALPDPVHHQPCHEPGERRKGRGESLEGKHAGVGGAVSAAARQLCGDADGLPGSIRIWRAGSRGRLLAAKRSRLRKGRNGQNDGSTRPPSDDAERLRHPDRETRRLVGTRLGDRYLRGPARKLSNVEAAQLPLGRRGSAHERIGRRH
jgi:cytochrome c oxidase subunit 1